MVLRERIEKGLQWKLPGMICCCGGGLERRGWLAFWVMIQKLNSGEICTVRENILGLWKIIIFTIHIFLKDFYNCINFEASLVLATYFLLYQTRLLPGVSLVGDIMCPLPKMTCQV